MGFEPTISDVLDLDAFIAFTCPLILPNFQCLIRLATSDVVDSCFMLTGCCNFQRSEGYFELLVSSG